MLTTTFMILMACVAAAGATNRSNVPSSTPKRIDMRKAISVTIDSKATWGGGFSAYLHVETNLKCGPPCPDPYPTPAPLRPCDHATMQSLLSVEFSR